MTSLSEYQQVFAVVIIKIKFMMDAGKETRLYLSDGKSMTVWNFPCRAAGPSPTSMYLLSATIGELIWACVRACASSSVSSLVEGEDTSSDLGRDKELCPGREKHRENEKTAGLRSKLRVCVSREVLCFLQSLSSQPLKDVVTTTILLEVCMTKKILYCESSLVCFRNKKSRGKQVA